MLLLLGFLWVNMMWNRIERVEVSPVLTSSTEGTNYLIVGGDSADEEAPGFDPARPSGQRADTMMILHFGSDGAKILSVPRDLWVTHAGSGQEGRINGTYNPDLGGGPSRLIETVTNELGIPIDRYMEVDFGSFAGLVDGLGGITIEFEHPATDPKSGLNVTETGPVELDGEQALAYVRSRTYTETIDGQPRVDPTGDLGRVERQQKFLSAVMDKMGTTKNPFALAGSFGNVTGGLRIDDKMSLMDAFRLAWRMRSLNLNEDSLLVLPTTATQMGGAAVLVLKEAEAPAVLDQFR